MAIIHRYIDELEALEQQHVFCGVPVSGHYNILIIGTFNPSNASCAKQNNASWFYGRKQNKFWRYLPTALTGTSLHENDYHTGQPASWRNYCINNKIIIIDLVKQIETDDILPNFGDRRVDNRINPDLSNANFFSIKAAFQGITFNKVLYSLKWADKKLEKLPKIRDKINQALIDNHCIERAGQIKYCHTPGRGNYPESWNGAVNQ